MIKKLPTIKVKENLARFRTHDSNVRMVQTARSHSLEGRPRCLTSLSEKNPPAKTPKDPPKTDAEKVQRPISKCG